jgi:signal transduction histidine kinase
VAREDSADASLRVSAHVLMQLGEELVTDVEQAILECVKNAYDADSPGCSVIVRTQNSGIESHTSEASKLQHFSTSSENVFVSFRDVKGNPVKANKLGKPMGIADDAVVTRDLKWLGSVVIEDTGNGISKEEIKNSWLVISSSSKRAKQGKKEKTNLGRTPLGDKGLGRLGSMKIGDILLVESSQTSSAPMSSALFRWTDCETANTVDEIPVRVRQRPNSANFKGTRVSILGIREIAQWARKERALEITKSLARLISPFEAKANFPVVVDVDGHKSSLVAVTDTLLSRAIAKFEFSWEVTEKAGVVLKCKALFREQLFRPKGNTKKITDKVEMTFGEDDGKGFLASLTESKRLKRFKIRSGLNREWLIELEQSFVWKDIAPTSGLPAVDPGVFSGNFYYFHLNKLSGDDEADVGELDEGAVAGMPIDRDMIKEMAGISILRDGFRVRSSGDWLKISEGMTSGSTYGLRFDNTLGYFALTGEHNCELIEKSDREGFVDNASLRGFMSIAETCRNFANDSMESVRRTQDDFVRERTRTREDGTPRSPEHSLEVVQKSIDFAAAARSGANEIVENLRQGIALVEAQFNDKGNRNGKRQAVETFRSALSAAATMQKKLENRPQTATAVAVLRQELSDNKDRMLALYESAAVGLSARGLAHELRTHLVEIRKRTSAIEDAFKEEKVTSKSVLPHLRSIRSSCGSISSAASLIDPMLPRMRSVKESINLHEFISEYAANRQLAFDKEEITFSLSRSNLNTTVRINRGRLLQVLDNLVRNSVYWLRRGQSFGIEREKKIRVAVTKDGFTLTDSGPGIDPNYEESIFEIFVTSKPAKERGQGLGLFIVTELLAADGADIYLTSERNEEGRRCKFAVNLSSVVEER